MDVEQWKKTKGEQILRKVGIKEGDKVLDFGCGSGIYSILASKVVNSSGKIYAIDSDEEGLLKELRQDIKSQKITKISVIETSGEIQFPMKQNTLDCVLIYDIYHLLDQKERMRLVRECARVLKKGGILSYHATHLGSGYDVSLKEVNATLEQSGFEFRDEIKAPMFHWAWIEKSRVFNYLRT